MVFLKIASGQSQRNWLHYSDYLIIILIWYNSWKLDCNHLVNIFGHRILYVFLYFFDDVACRQKHEDGLLSDEGKTLLHLTMLILKIFIDISEADGSFIFLSSIVLKSKDIFNIKTSDYIIPSFYHYKLFSTLDGSSYKVYP